MGAPPPVGAKPYIIESWKLVDKGGLLFVDDVATMLTALSDVAITEMLDGQSTKTTKQIDITALFDIGVLAGGLDIWAKDDGERPAGADVSVADFLVSQAQNGLAALLLSGDDAVRFAVRDANDKVPFRGVHIVLTNDPVVVASMAASDPSDCEASGYIRRGILTGPADIINKAAALLPTLKAQCGKRASACPSGSSSQAMTDGEMACQATGGAVPGTPAAAAQASVSASSTGLYIVGGIAAGVAGMWLLSKVLK